MTSTVPGQNDLTVSTQKWLDDFLLTLPLSLRVLSALVILALMACLPCMEYVILPGNPWQLPVIWHRSSLDGGAMRDENCQLEKLGKLPEFDSQVLAKCSPSSIGDEQFIRSLSALECAYPVPPHLPPPSEVYHDNPSTPPALNRARWFLLHAGVSWR